MLIRPRTQVRDLSSTGGVSPEVAVDTIAALRLYQGAATAAMVKYRAAFGDGGGGLFVVKPGDTTTADDGALVVVDALGRRWWRNYVGEINVLWFGDDATAFQAAADAAGAGGMVRVPERAAPYNLSTDITGGVLWLFEVGATTSGAGVITDRRFSFETTGAATHLINAGIPAFDADGQFVQDCGGVNIGGPTGVWLKQEGRDTDYEEGSLAAYPRVPNRWCGFSINSSAEHPSELPNQNIASVGVQILNGEGAEERLVISTHWLSPGNPSGDGEGRIGMIKTGGSTSYRPLRFHNADAYLMDVGADKTVAFTNQALSGGAGGNTVVAFRNPGTTESFRAVVRTDGAAGFEKLSSTSVDYSFLFSDTGARLSGSNPSLWWNEEDAGSNEKKWWLDASGGVLRGILINDAENAFSTWLNVYRTAATLTNITFAGDFTSAPLQVGPVGVGFFATGPTAKQTVTGSRGGNAALASLLTALATIGLITNSSS